mmetsp:Transcript_88436/g.255169  ORF Transcript_88436/g.255169 Transcript_88436/m.255169 type:complete len:237 (-) Transcript_88436:295-1005(-)
MFVKGERTTVVKRTMRTTRNSLITRTACRAFAGMPDIDCSMISVATVMQRSSTLIVVTTKSLVFQPPASPRKYLRQPRRFNLKPASTTNTSVQKISRANQIGCVGLWSMLSPRHAKLMETARTTAKANHQQPRSPSSFSSDIVDLARTPVTSSIMSSAVAVDNKANTSRTSDSTDSRTPRRSPPGSATNASNASKGTLPFGHSTAEAGPRPSCAHSRSSSMTTPTARSSTSSQPLR